MAANDLLALDALQTLQRRSVPVPASMSVIGHRDIPPLDKITPPLSTLRIRHYEMGFRAARLLLDTLRGVPGSAETSIVLRPHLVLRGSTAVPAPTPISKRKSASR